MLAKKRTKAIFFFFCEFLILRKFILKVFVECAYDNLQRKMLFLRMGTNDGLHSGHGSSQNFVRDSYGEISRRIDRFLWNILYIYCMQRRGTDSSKRCTATPVHLNNDLLLCVLEQCNIAIVQCLCKLCLINKQINVSSSWILSSLQRDFGYDRDSVGIYILYFFFVVQIAI